MKTCLQIPEKASSGDIAEEGLVELGRNRVHHGTQVTELTEGEGDPVGGARPLRPLSLLQDHHRAPSPMFASLCFLAEGVVLRCQSSLRDGIPQHAEVHNPEDKCPDERQAQKRGEGCVMGDGWED